MIDKYFEKFPIITYANTAVVNITERAVVLNSIYNSPAIFYPYDVQQGERADNIADRYYSDQYRSWIINLTNKIVDPYYDWYMDQFTFESFIIKKYGSLVNATSKVKYYRNNWYSNRNVITQSVHDNLDTSLKKFYEPVYADQDLSLIVVGYIRKAEDWKKTTNNVVMYDAPGMDFIHDEIVNVYCGSNLLGFGQVCARTETTTKIQHTSGVVTQNTCVGAFTLVGRESKNTKTYTTPTLLVDEIPAIELNYWDPVYCYDHENEINERNKTIQILKAEYSGQISKELRTLLK